MLIRKDFGQVGFQFLIWPLLSLAFLASPSAWAQADKDLREDLVHGSEALQSGQYLEAEKAFRAALQLQPNSVEVLNDLAITLVRQNRASEGIAVYKQALSIKPGDAITTRNLGIAYFRAQQYKNALPLLQEFAKTTPSFQSLDLLGLTLFALDRDKAAADVLERASQLQPRDLQVLNILGKAYFKAKQYSKVSDVFGRMMALDPDSAEGHVMMAMAYDGMNRGDEAESEYLAAIWNKSDMLGVHSGLGLLYMKRGKPEEAAEQFRQELKVYPRDPVSNFVLGQILRKQNDVSRAIPYLKIAVESDPNYKEAFFELGKCELLLNHPSEALAPLQRAVSLDHDYYEAHFVLGTALRKLGRNREATREQNIAEEVQKRDRAKKIASLNAK